MLLHVHMDVAILSGLLGVGSLRQDAPWLHIQELGHLHPAVALFMIIVGTTRCLDGVFARERERQQKHGCLRSICCTFMADRSFGSRIKLECVELRQEPCVHQAASCQVGSPAEGLY